MSKLLKKQNRFKWLIAPVTAILFFFLTLVLGKHPELTEKWYSNGIYPLIASVLSPVSSLLNFSISDVFYVLLLTALPVLAVFLIIRKISFASAGKLVLNTFAFAYFLFYLFWGFNYYRADLNSRLTLQTRDVTPEQYKTILIDLIEQTNKDFCDLETLSKAQSDSLVEESYKAFSGLLHIKYPSGSRKDKAITYSSFFAHSGISGYFGPFFNEVHVNKNVLPLEYPVVLAHEKAHQLGVTSEAEANFYAWLVCSQSPSQELRYAAGSFILRHFFSQAQLRDDYPELVSLIDHGVLEDFDRLRAHWEKLRNEKMEEVATQVNDAYLKTNQVEAGVQDYTGVVQFVLDVELDSAFQQKWHLNNN